MEPLKPPTTFKVYTVIKQAGLSLNYVYTSAAPTVSFGAGFYGTRDEAEKARTFELLKETADPKPIYHVFELDVPNPAYKE